MKYNFKIKWVVWGVLTLLIIFFTVLLKGMGLAERTYSTPATFTLKRGWILEVQFNGNLEVEVRAAADDYFYLRSTMEPGSIDSKPGGISEHSDFYLYNVFRGGPGKVQRWEVLGCSGSGSITFQVTAQEPTHIRLYPSEMAKKEHLTIIILINITIWLMITLVILLL